MPAIFDLLYREYCRARLAEMRKQLLISPKRHEVPEAFCDAKDVGANPAGGSEATTQHEPLNDLAATEAYCLMGIEDLMKTVWIYVDTSKQVGDAEHAKVFATTDAAEKWFGENDPEGVAFEYEVLE
jgi:hypothetical protein